VTHAGFLHDAEKEYVEARAVAALVAGAPVPGPRDLGVSPTAWMRGVAEAASELRRHLLDRLREGDLDRGETLLAAMDGVYAALVVVDYPDALTNGLRRTLDALRAVLERSRGDVTTTALQTRLQRAIEAASPGGASGGS
jgi:translin